MKNNLLILFLIILISSCATRREKSISYMNDHPEELAKLAAIHLKPRVEYKQGETVHITDTQYIDGEPIPCPPNENGEVVYVRGRDKVIRDTIFRTDTAYIANVAMEQVLRSQLRNVQDSLLLQKQDVARVKKQRNISFWGNGIIVLLVIGRIVLRRYL